MAEDQGEKKHPLAGNEFWKARSKHGRDKIFETPEMLWEACCEYFQWTHDNPLLEEKLFHFQGVVTRESVSKMRAMTISGLCIFLGISQKTWDVYAKRKDFLGVTGQVKEIIKTQKFEGAAADMLNANIIARDLGLRDKQDLTIANPEDRAFNLNFITHKASSGD